MKLLFICGQGMNRSRTAAEYFRGRYETQFAGVYSLQAESAITANQLAWADVVVVMEAEHRHELAKRFPALYLQKRILCLNIPDLYRRNDPKLVRLLENKLEQVLHA